MSTIALPGILQVLAYFAALLLLAYPLGLYMARVYDGGAESAQRVLGPLERLVYRVAGVDPAEDMPWTTYAAAALVFNLAGLLLLYLVQRTQHLLPWNPAGLPATTPEIALNTAISFATNTNWQAYGGETTMSHFTQMLGLTTQNFVSAAAGMAVLAALARGFRASGAGGIGSFWVDLTRSAFYILLPLSLGLALVLAALGVVQTVPGVATVTATLTDPYVAADGTSTVAQAIAVGPVASQVAIKQLGTNGGGFFNVNSAHPLENPTPLANFLECVAILVIPTALCFTFAAMVRDSRQAWVLLAAKLSILVPLLVLCLGAEQAGNPRLAALGVDQLASPLQPGGNMEGKEARFGIVASALWATATTAASNGSVNSMHDSFTPLGGLVPMLLMQLGEVVFGGVGSGLYGLLMFAIVAVFVAGLMVGRTPEFLGKKIEAFEMKMAAITILVPASAVLVGTAIACVVPDGTATLGNPGIHGFSEILYAFSSGANNNGSAFAGITVSGPFYAVAIGIAMLLGRYWIMVPVLAIAGSLAAKKLVPASAGTLPTHTPLFVVLLAGTVVLVGALTFVPALALGPIAEHLVLR